MISGPTRSTGSFSTWNQLATSLFRSSSGAASYSNPWSTEEEDHSVVDQQTIISCYKWLDRVVRLCQNPRLNLKNSPPYLLDTIPDVYEKLKSIISHYSDDYETLSQLEYFRVFIHSVMDKCKRTAKLFKEAGDKIFDVHSRARFRLIKLSLIFSHLHKDLEALFPQNAFCPGFRITKLDAARWWSSNFGSSVIVPWPVFQTALLRTFRVDSADQLIALRNTIDLTCNKYVSIFEFDVFIRLFQPWSNILETWKALTILHPGYMAFMTYDEVKAKLKQYRSHPGSGTYVFRLSCTKLGQWAIGYITEDLKILQTIIQNKSLAQALLDGEREGFYLYPNGESSPSSLLYRLVHDLPQVRLQVTQEQYQVYCEMGSTFELCKICDENNKDVQLEPCGHLICKHCLHNCRTAGYSQTCPFCRLEIKGIEDVIVDPYRPGLSHSNSVYDSFHIPEVSTDRLFKKPGTSSEPNGLFENSAPIDWGTSSSPLSAPPSPKLTPPPPSLKVHPPPVPPRNPSSICSLSLPNNFKHNSDCMHRSVDPSSCIKPIQSTGPTSSLLTPCSADFSPHFVLPTSLHTMPRSNCTCETLNAPAYASNSSHESTSSTLQVDPVTPSRSEDSRVRRLNYAQLDLNPSDSEQEALPIEVSANPSVDPSTIQPDATPLPGDDHRKLGDSSICPSRMDTTQRVTVPDLAHLDMNTGAPMLISRLLQTHADLNESTASLLLSITRNDLSMASQVWQHFMPRAGSKT